MVDNQEMIEEDYVYGWGRTKHIRDKDSQYPKGLCGASGGNPVNNRRPVCKTCLKIAGTVEEKWVRVGTWLLPQAYGVNYNHFTQTRMDNVPDRTVALYAKASDLIGGPYEYLAKEAG